MHTSAFNTLGDVWRMTSTGVDELKSKAQTKSAQLGETCQWIKNWGLSKTRHVKSFLPEGSSGSIAHPSLSTRTATQQSMRASVDQLKATLSTAQTKEQLESLVDKTRSLFGAALNKFSGHRLSSYISKASYQMETAVSEHSTSTTPPISLALKQEIRQITKETGNHEALEKVETELAEMELLEQQLHDLHDISKALHDMVQNQSQTVLRLEDCIDTAGLNVQKGTIEIDDSVLSSQQNKKLKVAISIALAILAAIALAVIIL